METLHSTHPTRSANAQLNAQGLGVGIFQHQNTSHRVPNLGFRLCGDVSGHCLGPQIHHGAHVPVAVRWPRVLESRGENHHQKVMRVFRLDVASAEVEAAAQLTARSG